MDKSIHSTANVQYVTPHAVKKCVNASSGMNEKCRMFYLRPETASVNHYRFRMVFHIFCNTFLVLCEMFNDSPKSLQNQILDFRSSCERVSQKEMAETHKIKDDTLAACKEELMPRVAKAAREICL